MLRRQGKDKKSQLLRSTPPVGAEGYAWMRVLWEPRNGGLTLPECDRKLHSEAHLVRGAAGDVAEEALEGRCWW